MAGRRRRAGLSTVMLITLALLAAGCASSEPGTTATGIPLAAPLSGG